MNHRYLATVCAVSAVVVLLPAFVVAQSANAPKTTWGAPDLQGVWDFRSLTPLERPEALSDKEFLTEEEFYKIIRNRSCNTRYNIMSRFMKRSVNVTDFGNRTYKC